MQFLTESRIAQFRVYAKIQNLVLNPALLLSSKGMLIHFCVPLFLHLLWRGKYLSNLPQVCEGEMKYIRALKKSLLKYKNIEDLQNKHTRTLTSLSDRVCIYKKQTLDQMISKFSFISKINSVNRSNQLSSQKVL